MSNVPKPFLKWAGGKRQLIPEIKKHLPDFNGDYYEPFIGAGALLFEISPKKAYINDVNEELINCYKIIENNIEELIDRLRNLENEFISCKNREEQVELYNSIRNIDRDDSKFSFLTKVERASRVIFLNKTCFNGLYRVNSKGQFNVPLGRQSTVNILDEVNLRNVHTYLKNNSIISSIGDFRKVVSTAKKGDFIYLDPPYDPISETSSFTSYAKDGFSKEDQVRLRDMFVELSKKECFVMLSNNRTPFIEELYKDYNIHVVKAGRAINSQGKGRGKVDEVLILNY